MTFKYQLFVTMEGHQELQTTDTIYRAPRIILEILAHDDTVVLIVG